MPKIAYGIDIHWLSSGCLRNLASYGTYNLLILFYGQCNTYRVVWLSGRMLVWLYVWREVQICIYPSWCHCHSLSLAPVNPGWFYLPGFTFLVPAHPATPGQSERAVKRLGARACVCVMEWVKVSHPTELKIGRFHLGDVLHSQSLAWYWRK